MNPTSFFPSAKKEQIHPCTDPPILGYVVGGSGPLLRDSVMHLQAPQLHWSRKFIARALDAK